MSSAGETTRAGALLTRAVPMSTFIEMLEALNADGEDGRHAGAAR